MLNRIYVVVAFILTVQLPIIDAQENTEIGNKTAADTTISHKDNSNRGEYFVAYYFHGDKRCATCKKLEAYSGEAFESGFQKELKDSLLIWKPVNYDERENKHFINDYNLYTKTLILSKIKDGEEVEWKDLDRIWKLVGNKDKYIEYIQSETRNFISRADNDE